MGNVYHPPSPNTTRSCLLDINQATLEESDLGPGAGDSAMKGKGVEKWGNNIGEIWEDPPRNVALNVENLIYRCAGVWNQHFLWDILSGYGKLKSKSMVFRLISLKKNTVKIPWMVWHMV